MNSPIVTIEAPRPSRKYTRQELLVMAYIARAALARVNALFDRAFSELERERNEQN